MGLGLNFNPNLNPKTYLKKFEEQSNRRMEKNAFNTCPISEDRELSHFKKTQSNLSLLRRKEMDSSGHHFSEYGNSERHNEWWKQCSDGSDRMLQLRFHQVIRCGSYGSAIITNISFRFML